MAFSDYKKKKLQEQAQANEKQWTTEYTGKTKNTSGGRGGIRAYADNSVLSNMQDPNLSFNNRGEHVNPVGDYLKNQLTGPIESETSATDVKGDNTPATNAPSKDTSSAGTPTTETSSTVKSALALLQDLRNKQYADPYGKQLEELINNWNNREKFSYDLNTDPLYLSAKAEAEATGDLAMRDTIGKMSTMTGGYSNSYAQTAGQQMYNKYLEELNANVPSFYEAAYDKYYNDAMLDAQKIDNIRALRDEDYALWQDEYNRELDYISSLYGMEQDQQALLEGLLGSDGALGSSDSLVSDIGIDTKDTEAALKALATGGSSGLSRYLSILYGSLEGDGKDSYIQELLNTMKNSDLYARVALQDAKNWNFDVNPEGKNVITDIIGNTTYTEEGLINNLAYELSNVYGVSEAKDMAKEAVKNLKAYLGK